ncbi:hypothetical protein MKW98_028076 [Papaver atlanticum]|uniref:Helicase ATP-binding domain-containing protein n=1 Tax=Papaver atlanticum TaxID=357466 RepID=A0AAD4SY00_9MAGN|nr:hypothetical protein MKW98_028076 [Papaver atlanticum]
MRVIKPSKKFRFTFDWDATKDTSRDLNSLYQNPHEAKLLFGKGFRAGSGKTAAFVLPMLAYISRLPPMTDANAVQGTYAVVLAPTRELAQQIENETVKFAHYLGIRVVSIVGKKSILEQVEEVRKGVKL